jgi:general stress protein 26
MAAARWRSPAAGLSLALAGVLQACGPEPSPAPREATREAVLEAAREIMAAARFAALVTVDADGYPRARTVAPLPALPGDGPMSVWIATRPATRKVAEIQAEPRAVLYYFDAERREYATLTGRARIVGDRAEVERRSAHLSRELYPSWPADCVLIELLPERLEVQGRGLEPDAETWRPVGITLP